MFCFGFPLQGAFRTLLTTVTHLCNFGFAVCVGAWMCVHVVRGNCLTLLLHKRAAALISLLGAGFIYFTVAFSISHTLCHVQSDLFCQINLYLFLHFFYSPDCSTISVSGSLICVCACH